RTRTAGRFSWRRKPSRRSRTARAPRAGVSARRGRTARLAKIGSLKPQTEREAVGAGELVGIRRRGLPESGSLLPVHALLRHLAGQRVEGQTAFIRARLDTR